MAYNLLIKNGRIISLCSPGHLWHLSGVKREESTSPDHHTREGPSNQTRAVGSSCPLGLAGFTITRYI